MCVICLLLFVYFCSCSSFCCCCFASVSQSAFVCSVVLLPVNPRFAEYREATVQREFCCSVLSITSL